MTHSDLDALDNFMEKKEESPRDSGEPSMNGSLSVCVPMDDFKLMLRQMWKSRQTEPRMGELYEKYTELTTFEE